MSSRDATPKQNAENAYLTAHRKAHDLIKRIGEMLFDLPAPGDGDHPIHWGHVGDVNHVNALLREVVAFLDRGGE